MFNMYLNEKLFVDLVERGLNIEEVCQDFYKETIWIEEIFRYPTAKELSEEKKI